jgi:hypothetical protein
MSFMMIDRVRVLLVVESHSSLERLRAFFWDEAADIELVCPPSAQIGGCGRFAFSQVMRAIRETEPHVVVHDSDANILKQSAYSNILTEYPWLPIVRICPDGRVALTRFVQVTQSIESHRPPLDTPNAVLAAVRDCVGSVACTASEESLDKAVSFGRHS